MRVSTPIYELKITLRGIEPPVWRRIQVASDITLYRLHGQLQIVMGWSDSHLHRFSRGRTVYGTSDQKFGNARLSEKKVRLKNVLGRPGETVAYEYDFGDSWEHDVVLERVLQPDPDTTYPVCLAAQRACPPEDCGGVPGYYDLLEALANPEHPEHEHQMEWTGGGFDPEKFSVDAINRHFQLKSKGRSTHG